jgi:hypothetical protein
LYSVECGTKGRKISLGEGRKQSHQHQMGHVLNVSFRGLGDFVERGRLVCTADSRRRIRDGDDTPPRRWKWDARKKRRNPVPISTASSLKYETTSRKCPRANRGPPSPAHRARKAGRVGLDVVEFCHRPSDRKRELSA